jgi:hypothetical protein
MIVRTIDLLLDFEKLFFNCIQYGPKMCRIKNMDKSLHRDGGDEEDP